MAGFAGVVGLRKNRPKKGGLREGYLNGLIYLQHQVSTDLWFFCGLQYAMRFYTEPFF